MILTNERVNAETALRIGLVEQVVPRGTEPANGAGIAQRVSTLSPRAVNFSKQLIHQARQGTPRSAALALERERFIDLFDGADQQEGVERILREAQAGVEERVSGWAPWEHRRRSSARIAEQRRTSFTLNRPARRSMPCPSR